MEIVNMEIEMMEKEATQPIKNRTLLSILRDKDKRLHLILTCVIQGSQQLCGVTSVKLN